MAERALPPGVVRRRTFFGLLDAEGWTVAALKGLFWFVAIIFLLGYLPDRAYYFTVFPTIDVGANVISPVNFCPPGNKNLPCPAPVGAVVPWEPSPRELALPEGRSGAATVQSGTTLYLVGGTVGGRATAEVLQTQVTTGGNFGTWQPGPALPAARSGAAVVSLSGVPYVIGGLDEAGRPTDTVFAGVLEEGRLTGWEPRNQEQEPNLTLPEPISGASAVATGGGFYVMGGRGEDGLRRTVYRSVLDSAVTPPALRPWEEVAQLPLPEPRADAAGVIVGNTIYLVGGEGPQGVTERLLRLQLDADGEPLQGGGGLPLGWATSGGDRSLPARRTQVAGFTSNSILYVIGGRDENGQPARNVYWSTPTAQGDLPGWQRLEQSELPEGRANAPVAVVGSFAFLIGGEGPAGAASNSLRASIAPEPPFFRLGLFGATIPALSIKGEIGQQLGYLNAAGVGTVNFILLILIGLAHSHPAATRRFLERVTRGRYRAPREDEYAGL